jgi:Uma2 family endonuclease
MGVITERVVYPDSDGQPMADNTKQFAEIVMVKEGLEALFASRPDVFVAGDLLWYPVEGQPKVRLAPDVLVAIGRPKGHRGSYQQWNEGNIAPQVVFEILSPGNRLTEMFGKLAFYERYGVEEYYVYNPDNFELSVLIRTEAGSLQSVVPLDGFVSPLLGIVFAATGEDPWTIFRPDGEAFLSYVALMASRNDARDQAARESERAEAERERANAESARAERLAARLREAGIDPDAV